MVNKLVILLYLLLMAAASEEYAYLQTKQKLRKKNVQVLSVQDGMSEADIQRIIDEKMRLHPNLKVSKQKVQQQGMVSFTQIGEQMKTDASNQPPIDHTIPLLTEQEELTGEQLTLQVPEKTSFLQTKVPQTEPPTSEPEPQVAETEVPDDQPLQEPPNFVETEYESNGFIKGKLEKCRCKFKQESESTEKVEGRCQGELPEESFTVHLTRQEMVELLKYHRGLDRKQAIQDESDPSFLQMAAAPAFDIQHNQIYAQQPQQRFPQQQIVYTQPQQQLAQLQQQALFSILQQQQGIQPEGVYVQQQPHQQQVLQQPQQLIQVPQQNYVQQQFQQPQQIMVQQPQQILVQGQQPPQQMVVQQQPQQIMQNQQPQQMVVQQQPQQVIVQQPQQMVVQQPQQQQFIQQPQQQQFYQYPQGTQQYVIAQQPQAQVQMMQNIPNSNGGLNMMLIPQNFQQAQVQQLVQSSIPQYAQYQPQVVYETVGFLPPVLGSQQIIRQ